MNIALLTIWHEGNYGAELQAYATIKILKQLGHDVRMIDIRLSDIPGMSLRGRIGCFLSSFGPSSRKFNKFWSEKFPLTRRYRSVAELKQNPPEADVYMVGSDQVWNTEITRSFSEIYFLNFGLDTIKRVSYASSFGKESWGNYPTDTVKPLLERFQAISCRENSGVRILKETFGVESMNVLDPTLLFDNYAELTGKIEEVPTLAYYPLDNSPELESYSESLAKRLGLKTVNANWKTYIYGSAVWDRNSIGGWIRDIAQSKFIITPSFHGLSMCLIYQRQFAVIVENKARATRMISLLERLNLQDRVFNSFEEMEKSQPWAMPIDYNTVNEKLSKLRDKSLDFLKIALA